MQWGAACFALHTGDLFVPNSDAIGLFPGLTDDEALAAINYCLITRSVVEIAGWLYRDPDNPRLAWLRKAICCPNNGQDVHLVGFDYRNERHVAPTTWYIETAHFARQPSAGLPVRTVAIFNLDDEPRTVSVTPSDLGLPAGTWRFTNVWTGDSSCLDAAFETRLAPHASILLAVNPGHDALELLDANHEVAASHRDGDSLSLTLRHPGPADLCFNHPPREASLDGRPIPIAGSRLLLDLLGSVSCLTLQA